MTDLDIIAQLEGKIQQLPPQVAIEVNDYVDFLLRKYQPRSLQKLQGVWEDLVRETSGSWQDMPK